MRRVITILPVFLLISFSSALFSQDKYERKSISYINALWLATPDARAVEDDQVATMLNTIKTHIEIERFDYNPLPEAIIRNFVQAANAQDNLTVDQIASLMQQKMVPVIIEILEGAMRERGGELVSEEQKQSFLATKAKEIGITLEEIEKVMNSAYIYLPVLTDYKRKKDKDTDKITYTIEGGIIWFHVSTTGEEPEVSLRVSNTTFSQGFGRDEFAWESAVMNFARNLQVATQEIAEFKLSNTISEVDNGDIYFGLGTKEGLRVDDCYFVGEWVDYGDGDVEFEQSGWVRIGKVGNNRRDQTAKSSAWAVKKGSWVPGMVVVEHPRLGIDIAFKPMLSQMEVTAGYITFNISNTLRDALYIREDYSKFVPGLDLDAHYNLGALTGVSQLFFLVGGNYAIPTGLEFDSDNFPKMTTSSFIWGVHSGFLKKFYFGQTAIGIEAKGGIKFFTVKQKLTAFLIDYEFTIKNRSYGGQANINFEYAVTPDFHVGAIAGFHLFPDIELWYLDVDPSGFTFYDNYDKFPDINHVGPCFGIYLHYSFPSLPFDPLSFIKGSMQD